jgi:hypothetical protein
VFCLESLPRDENGYEQGLAVHREDAGAQGDAFPRMTMGFRDYALYCDPICLFLTQHRTER